MKRKVYIETSVVSYYTGRASRDVVVAGHQQSTHDFWTKISGTGISENLLPYVSALVLKEASKGDPEQARRRLDAIRPFSVIRTVPEAEHLAQDIVDGHGIPVEYPEDALHIAVAAVGGMEFIVTWNFAHMNNPFTKMMIRQTVENSGYECPEIVSPEAFLKDET